MRDLMGLGSLVRLAVFFAAMLTAANAEDDVDLTDDQRSIVNRFQQRRIDTIDRVIDSVISIYGEQRQGGGSGVIISPSGIGLTNHHVIMGAGTSGWGGLSDGKLYSWKLIGTDPGGDVAIIQMEGRDDFPYTPLADSDRVQVGDWALAMGNPFLLTEDQVPTVTLGIVSGVNRYQAGAGMNQLVYGNCIQTDSSINPGNSGGPLFNMDAQVIGINGRGSFKERDRVNVGLGYAISANQIKNFIPELLATKLVEHGTLDASFEDRDGKVVCASLFEDSRLYQQGVRPGDELLEFEGQVISAANQFTNLICTLPENWPASLLLRKNDGRTLSVNTRLYGLPYPTPRPPKIPENEKDWTPEQQEQMKRAMAMIDLLSAPPGEIRLEDVNRQYCQYIMDQWLGDRPEQDQPTESDRVRIWEIRDQVSRDGTDVGTQRIQLASDGSFAMNTTIDGRETRLFGDDGVVREVRQDQAKSLSPVEVKLNPLVVQALGLLAANDLRRFDTLGETLLDGSDKALSMNAFRLKAVDDKEDPFYFWLSMPRGGVHGLPQLLKAAADMNCESESGGVVFQDWKTDQGLRVSRLRKHVAGLDEAAQLAFQTVNATHRWVEREQLRQELGFPETIDERP